MGLADFFKGKSESFAIEDLDDKQIKAALKGKKVPTLTAKELKKMKQDDLRRMVGESGLKALKSAASDRADYLQRRSRQVEAQVQRAKTPVDLARIKANDPKAYQALLEREARRQGLI